MLLQVANKMRIYFLLNLLLLPTIFSFTDKPDSTTGSEYLCISDTEAHLAALVNEYRGSRHLPPIPVSVSLTKVARFHVNDLVENFTPGQKCNLHSWSSDPRWSSCCYTPDHKKAACMWDKPRELTSYKGDGYEIAFTSTYRYSSKEEFIKDALEGWKSSKGHNELLINGGKWKTSNWKAMGIAIKGDYAVIWFGELPDEEGEPLLCKY